MSLSRCSLALLSLAGLILSGCGPSSPGKTKPPPAASVSRVAVSAPAAHEHEPPHGGTLVELGEEFAHVEVVFARATGRLTVYLLDGEAEAAVRTRQADLTARIERLDIDGRPLPGVPWLTLPLEALASPLTGEVVGSASQFAGAHEAIRGHARIRGVLEQVEVRGRAFEQVAFDLAP